MENEPFVIQRNDESDEAPKAEKGEPQGKTTEGRVVKVDPHCWKAKFYSFRTVFSEEMTAR